MEDLLALEEFLVCLESIVDFKVSVRCRITIQRGPEILTLHSAGKVAKLGIVMLCTL